MQQWETNILNIPPMLSPCVHTVLRCLLCIPVHSQHSPLVLDEVGRVPQRWVTLDNRYTQYMTHVQSMSPHTSTEVVHDVWGVLGVHWNAHRTSRKSVDTCTQHGGYIEYICCTVLPTVLAPYTRRTRRMWSARSALERTQDV